MNQSNSIPASGVPRFAALDALRGFAILTMVLSGAIPYGILPAWMYHCQVPPPHHKFDPSIPGITWVDLVFPFFLFCLGAAIPFALERRMQKGLTRLEAVGVIAKRGFLLFVFAIYQAHFSPFNIAVQPDWLRWVYALAGFALLFPMMMRLPEEWPAHRHWLTRAVGWGCAIVLLTQMRYKSSPTSFSLYRSNIILMLLTVSAFFGSLAWLFTRDRLVLRLGVLGFLLAHRLAHNNPGWVKWLTDSVSVPGIWNLSYIHYLFIVLPGAIAGDEMLRWCRQRQQDTTRSWSSSRLVGLTVLGPLTTLVALVGLKARWVEATVVTELVLVGLALWLTRRAASATEIFLRRMVEWGGYWLLLGLAFEPYEGGIKKDPNTLSYFFVTTGLALLLIVTLTIVADLWSWRGGIIRLLVANGQNPMIAYVGMGNLIEPILALTGLGPVLERIMPGPWLGTLRGFLLTLLLAWIVALFTKRKIFWRT